MNHCPLISENTRFILEVAYPQWDAQDSAVFAVTQFMISVALVSLVNSPSSVPLKSDFIAEDILKSIFFQFVVRDT